jgi:hypothetical protein
LVVPTTSRALTRTGLSLYQPMSGLARVAWRAALLGAGLGVFKLLRETPAPPSLAQVSRYLPPDGSIAVAHTGPHRAVVLLLDSGGNARGVAKIASDAAGLSQLEREAHALTALGPLLKPPVSAPRLLAIERGLLLFEPISWRLRSHPWILPRALASAIGRFHHSDGHPSHGDFAPWNIMATAGGWVLLDWEEARLASPAFTDPLHYLVHAHALLGRPRTGELIAGLRGGGWIGRSLKAYAEAAGLDVATTEEAAVEYLARSRRQLQLDPRQRGRVRAIVAREELLARLQSRR